MKDKAFKCPYEEIECVHINTSGMSTDIDCEKCEHYGKGIRSTGAMPILGWLMGIFKNKKDTKSC